MEIMPRSFLAFGEMSPWWIMDDYPWMVNMGSPCIPSVRFVSKTIQKIVYLVSRFFFTGCSCAQRFRPYLLGQLSFKFSHFMVFCRDYGLSEILASHLFFYDDIWQTVKILIQFSRLANQMPVMTNLTIDLRVVLLEK